jgi:hypothetical protein
MPEPTADPLQKRIRDLIEGLIGDLGRLGMDRQNAARLMVVQGAIRLDELADLEEMQDFIDREVAEWGDDDAPVPHLRIVN